jgi:hypothetical protein
MAGGHHGIKYHFFGMALGYFEKRYPSIIPSSFPVATTGSPVYHWRVVAEK